jgi:rare lipoprotein A
MTTKTLLLMSAFLSMLSSPALSKSCGRASWYHEGSRTANGEYFRPDGFTAAHRTLGFGSILDVVSGNRHVHVRVNDRGPAAWTGRDLDLSRGAARGLGMMHDGVRHVCYSVIGKGSRGNHRHKRNRRRHCR